MSRGNRYKKTKKSITIKRVICFILFFAFVALFIVSGFKIIKYYKDMKENSRIQEEISKYITINNNDSDKADIEVNFEELKKINPDVIGFLKIDGTDINHVVVKGTNNDYYLTHNLEKNNNKGGWIFADYHNKLDGLDKNIIIYGHNMHNNSMFGTLKNVLTDEWKNNEENRYISFITEQEKNIYKVFAVYQTGEDDIIPIEFKDDEFSAFINKVKAKSKYDFNVDVSNDDQILTLSTCANNNKYRIIVHAKKIE